jgi:hypothetical protein
MLWLSIWKGLFGFSRVYLDLPIYWGSIWHKGLFGRNSLTVRTVNPPLSAYRILKKGVNPPPRLMFETQWSKMQKKMSDDYHPLMPNTILTLIGDEKLFSWVIWYNRSQKPMISENALSCLIYFCSLYNQISNTLSMRTIEQAGWSINDLNHFPNYNAKTFAAFLIYLNMMVCLKILSWL